MKKEIVITALITAVVTIGILAVVFAAINNSNNFNGTVEKTPDSFVLDFSKMDKEDAHQFEMKKGDAITVGFGIEKGDVDITIGKTADNLIYEGNDVDKGAYTININSDGVYTVIVKAKNAKGFVAFNAVENGAIEKTTKEG